jgi:hypothetical protein
MIFVCIDFIDNIFLVINRLLNLFTHINILITNKENEKMKKSNLNFIVEKIGSVSEKKNSDPKKITSESERCQVSIVLYRTCYFSILYYYFKH